MIYPRAISGLVVCSLVLGLLGILQPSWAADTDTPWVSRVVSIQGRVLAKRHGKTDWRPVRLDDTLFVGDQIRVGANSRAGIVLSNDAVIRLDQNTTLMFSDIEQQSNFILELLKGAAHFFSTWPRRLKIVTPFVNGVVEGTEFLVRVDDRQTQIDLFEGRIRAANEFGELQLAKGQGAVASAKSAPQSRVLVHPRNSVQWSLYYPPILAAGPDSGIDAFREANALYNKGQAAEALDAMESIPESDWDSSYYAYRAALLLNVGRVDQAQIDIQRALSLRAANSEALALKAIIAVVQNRKEDALQAAEQAVQLDPRSAEAQIALSYARQAEFNLQAAIKAAQAAVAHEPENGTAWARLAELRLSTGELDKGVQAAQKAAVLNPHIAHAHTILGFAYLTQIKTKKAQAAFTQAIALDSVAPLPRLGMGLATIRQGDLEKGRAEIEIAAGLDTGNALIRSYLGKAYFEEKRGPLDERQFEIAKNLDPNDPTPWFYDAIRKQTINRPVEALHDLQKAIELNDNRAVYRSKLLLDSDLAARSSSLARIYNNLGFQQRGLVEGWNSVNTDPTNFSAHRLLADSYAVLPRHEIARVSELLQSQLLQPINITPIQPALAESNLFLISAQGPAAAGFNAFNPLFNRNQVALQASGLVGENDMQGAEGIFSGIYNKLSLSAGYSHFETDGWRKNAQQDDNIANIFAQYELSYKTSMQAEYRYRDTDRGDTQLRFFEDDFLPNLDEEENTKTFRFGFRHAFTPASIMIGNFSLQDSNPGIKDFVLIDPGRVGLPLPPLESINKIDGDEDSYGGELQYLWRSRYFNMVSGAGYFNIDSDNKTSQVVTWPGEAPPLLIREIADRIKTDTDHYNLYLYSYINPLNNVTFTVGASADFFDLDGKKGNDRNLDKNKFNPKLGISWKPFAGTTLRGALFRTLTKTLVSAQTIEPTQLAGFNQFFDDFNATEAWVYGVALDQKFNQNFYGGVEFVYRDLDVPFLVQPGPAEPFNFEEADWDEYLGRAYLYYTPHDWFSLTAEYLYEKLDRDEEFTFGIKEVKTHRVPLGVNFFHPFGLNVGFKATYVNQDGEFKRQTGGIESGDDDFWLVDAAISYRLPKRYGFITVGVKNLFDESFEYADTDINNPTILPDRSIFGKITLSLP